MRRAVLALLAVLGGLIFPSVYSATPPGVPDAAHAVPALSGAQNAEPRNGDLTAAGADSVGTPNYNFDLETAPGPLVVAPLLNNYNFANGLASWSVLNSVSVQAGGPSGYYAHLEPGGQMSNYDGQYGYGSFWPYGDVLRYKYRPTTPTYYFNFAVLGGPFYSQVVGGGGVNCSFNCPTDWTEVTIDAAAFRGTPVAIVIGTGGDGAVDFTDVAVPYNLTPGWTSSVPGSANIVEQGVGQHYLRTSSAVWTHVSVDPEGQGGTALPDAQSQQATFRLKVESGSGAYIVTVDGITVLSGTQAPGGWQDKVLSIGAWSGQSPEVRVIPGSGTVLGIDDAFRTQNLVGAWRQSGAEFPQLAEENGVRFLTQVGELKSPRFKFSYPTNATMWLRVCYRLKTSYTTLRVENETDPSVALLSVTGGGLNVWRESYFSATAAQLGTGYGGLKILATGASGASRPDVSCLERVDGPGQYKVGGNPAAIAGALGNKALTGTVGLGVEPTSGAFISSALDLAIPGRGVPLSFGRIYSSAAVRNGSMGAKWSHSWDISVTPAPGGNVAFVKLPGGVTEAYYGSGSSFTKPAGVEASLANVGPGWTLTTVDQVVFNFDANGRLTSVADRNANTTTLSYSGQGDLATITDAGGRSLVLSYASYAGVNRITSVSDGARSVGYAYDAAGNLATVTNVLGGSVGYQYSTHLLTRITDARGNYAVRNTYDWLGRVTTQQDALNGTIGIAYSIPGTGATRVTDQRSKVATVYFDTSMRVTNAMNHDGGVVTWTFDSDNNRTSVQDPLGHTWSGTFDAAGNQLSATDPRAKTWSFAFTSKNDVSQGTDPQNKTTALTYNAAGNLQAVTDANNRTENVSRTPQGDVSGVTDELGHLTTFGYDAYGNRTTVTNALGRTWTTAYDTKGRVVSVTDPLAHSTSYTYNNANLVLSATNALSQTTTYTYDANGNVLTVTDANSRATTYTYSARNQLLTVRDAANGVSSFTYDAVGNIVSKTNPRGKTTTYTYNNVNRLITETDPLSHVRSYAYDAAGRLIRRTDAKNQITNYTYNNRNELTTVSYPDASTVTLTYNDAGARTAMTDSTGTTSCTYDNLYRLTSVTFPGGRTVAYGYDDAGRRTSITYPNGAGTVSYGYDNANRLTAVTDLNSGQTQYAYDTANRMTSATLPNGVISAYSYDNADGLTGITHVKNGTTLASASYTLDPVGNRTQRVDQAGTQTYAYDSLYRLTSATYPGPNTTNYAYDAFGNRTSMTTAAGTTSYAYDNADRLTSVTPPSPAPVVNYTWDNNGNLTNRGADTFTWDFEDRMTTATVGGAASTFTYRGDGLRNTRTSGGVTSTFTWDIAAGVPKVLDDGAAKYVYGAGLISQKSASGTFYYLTDGLDTVMKTTDAGGNVVNAYAYDVYGKTTSASGGQTNDVQFAGEQTDSTGLQYLRARYYDPATGRFLSRDPLSVMPGWSGNAFGYAGGNPVSRRDPSGMATVWDDARGLWYDDANGAIWSDSANSWVDLSSGMYWSAAEGWHSPSSALNGRAVTGCLPGPAGAPGGDGDAAGEASAGAGCVIGASPGLGGRGVAEEGAPSIGRTIAQVQLNRANGLAAQQAFVKSLRANGVQVVGEEVAVATPFGNRILDVVFREGGVYNAFEVKSGFAILNPMQLLKDMWINTYGGQVIGRYSSSIDVVDHVTTVWAR